MRRKAVVTGGKIDATLFRATEIELTEEEYLNYLEYIHSSTVNDSESIDVKKKDNPLVMTYTPLNTPYKVGRKVYVAYPYYRFGVVEDNSDGILRIRMDAGDIHVYYHPRDYNTAPIKVVKPCK